ncbi:MAG: ATP-binding cassette domain-containing protein [Candidatus Doudnabacteria bacterium]|nr:ATP-binding cassette domain-containing protein [Candidatus Doudnabacteria bacterium]
MTETFAIQLCNISKSFQGNKVLDGVNLKVKKGTILALLGPNGAGKTTTIRILSTLLKADGGEAFVNGFEVSRYSKKVRENIGLTGQYAAVDEFLSGRENLEMMGRLYHLGAKESKQRAHELLEQFSLTEAASRSVKTYSGGMRRRLDLAASLVATPPVLFLDEPTTGLDPRSRLAMWDVIEKLVEAKVTILLTTQYLEEADQLADEIAVLDSGKIIAQGTANELKAKVGKERLEIVVHEKSSFKKAVEILNIEAVEVDESRRSISISTEGSVGEIRRLLDKMEQAGIEVEGLNLHKPTLDDVFLRLTGHKTEQEREHIDS